MAGAGAALEGETDGLLAFWDEVNREDIAIVERVQSGVADPAYTGGRMCYRFEESVHRFQNMLIDHMLGLRRVPAGDAVAQRPCSRADQREERFRGSVPPSGCSAPNSSGWNWVPHQRRSESAIACTAQAALEASTRKPSGICVTSSV